MKSFEAPVRHHLSFGKKEIAFDLLLSERTTMEIAVYPNCSVQVKAPLDSGMEAIEKKLRKRVLWILKQQDFFRLFEHKAPQRAYVSGETHRYLGKHYRLKIEQGAENSVKLKNGYFYVCCKNEATPQAVKMLLLRWYTAKARVVFAERLERCAAKFKGLDFEDLKWCIKKMQTRWGSLSEKELITLNIELIKTPKECIDYVITHELCHLYYHNHSTEFYQLLEAMYPSWKEIKYKLEMSVI